MASLIDLFPGVLRHLKNDKERIHISPPIPVLKPIAKGGCIRPKKTKRKY